MSEAPASEPSADAAAAVSVGTLFDLLPIGAYRSAPDGRQLRANPALVRLNGYADEAEMLAGVRDIGSGWYVQPGRRDEFRRLLERDGQVVGFVSEVWRHKTRERIWVSEHAHLVRDAQGRVLFYEGTVEEVTERVQAQAALVRSEDELRRLAEHLPGMAYRAEIDAEGRRRFVYVSGGVRALFGVEPGEATAHPNALARRVHPEDRAAVQRAVESADTGQPLVTEFRVLRPDGTLKWVEVHAATIDLGDGRRVRNGVMLDISERKRAEAEIRASEERWKLAMDSTGDGVWDWNIETGEERVSPRFLQMYGFDAGEIAARHQAFDDRTHPDDVVQMLRDRDAHFEGRTPRYVNEHRVRCKDGTWKWVLSRGLVIKRAADGRPLRMIGTHTDITARKQAEALRQERDRAEAADRAKSHLLSRVSHELRTPLNAVLGFAQLLAEVPGLDARQREWLGHILTSGRHLLGVVEDVLDLSSAQTGQLSLALADVELGDVLDSAWTMLDDTARRADIGFERRGFDGASLRVRADRRRLKQVLLNLLSNAIKYNRAGGRIRVGATPHAEVVTLEVEDTGPGMTEEQLARLFRPFERLGAEYGNVEGSGLGLALARQLVDAMGGTIEVHSTPGRGTTFRVQLPLAP